MSRLIEGNELVIGRRNMLKRTAAGMIALPSLAASAGAETASAGGGTEGLSLIERNKKSIEDQHEQQQFGAVPPTIMGAAEPVQVATADGATLVSAQYPPGGVDDPKLVLAAIAGWHMQSTAPPIHSFGPFIAEDDAVVEEWETFFHGADATMYSNHYVLARRFKDGKVIGTHEYLDSHHAFTVLGLHGPWKELAPARAPRRRWLPGRSTADLPPLTEMETAFPIRLQFNLDPRMLCDVIPAGRPSKVSPATVEGNKAVVQGMREAQATGNAAALASFHRKGFRHFIAGEGPFGWEHLPIEALYAPLVKHLEGPIKIRYGPMVSEGGRVFEEMDILAHLDDGSVYNNWHCFIHEIRDGQIAETREYMDTHHFWVMLARWADWGKVPVPPMRQARRSNLPFVRATYQVRNPFLNIDRWKPLPPPKA